MANNYIVLDCETGGLDETKTPMTQLAFKAIDGETFEEILKFETFIKPYGGLIIDQKVLETKSTVKMSDIVKYGIDSKELVSKIIYTFKNLKTTSKGDSGLPVLVGHNVKFDIKFLRYVFHLHGQDLFNYISIDTFDTQRLSNLTWKSQLKSGEAQAMRLGICCKRAGIELVDAHGAMADVEATTKLFIYFIDRLISSTTSSGEKEKKTNNNRTYYQF